MHAIRLRHEFSRGMNSCSRPWAGGGFTLLEIVVVMVIMMLLLGVSVVSFDAVMREGEVREPVLKFKDLTAEAVRRATLYERPQVLLFDKQGVAMPLRAPQANDGTPVAVKRVILPPGMSLSLRRFGSEKFFPAEGQRLIISPSGLCEPLTARFQQDRAWFEVTLDPLTGAAKEERMVLE